MFISKDKVKYLEDKIKELRDRLDAIEGPGLVTCEVCGCLLPRLLAKAGRETIKREMKFRPMSFCWYEHVSIHTPYYCKEHKPADKEP